MSSCGWLEALLEAAAAQSITQLAAPRVGMKCDVHATAAACRLRQAGPRSPRRSRPVFQGLLWTAWQGVARGYSHWSLLCRCAQRLCLMQSCRGRSRRRGTRTAARHRSILHPVCSVGHQIHASPTQPNACMKVTWRIGQKLQVCMWGRGGAGEAGAAA